MKKNGFDSHTWFIEVLRCIDICMTGLASQFFLIYRITNLINGKVYVGKHRTLDKNDSYMGSGKLLKRAISKYGIEQFKKEILFECSSEKEMNVKEAEIVNEGFCSRNDTYNLCPGGNGGWGFVNANGLANTERQRRIAAEQIVMNSNNIEQRRRSSVRMKQLTDRKIAEGTHFIPVTLGFKFSEESKIKMSNSHLGEQNSQFGTIWISNGIDRKKIKSQDSIPDGWYRGRK